MKKMLIHNHRRNNIGIEKYLKKWILLFFILPFIIALGQNTTDNKKNKNTTDSTQKKQKLSLATEHETSNSKKTADSLITTSNQHIKKGDFSLALTTVQQALTLYKTVNDNKSIGNCFNKIASIYYYQANYPEALSYYSQSIPFYKKSGFKKGIVSSINNKGAIYYFLGNYPKALDHYKQAVKLNEALNNKKQTAATIQNIGGIYLELNDYANAMTHFQMAKKTYESINDKKTLSQVLNGIGEVYLKQEKFHQALSNFEQGLQLAEDINDQQRILESLYNLGEIYYIQKKYQIALDYYHNSLKLAKELNNVLYNGLSLIGIGVTNFKLGKNQSAIKDCKEGFEIANELKTISVQKNACKCLYEVYKSLGRKGVALTYYEQSIRLKDSLQAKQTTDKILNMEFEKQMLMDSIAHVEKRRKLQAKHKQVVQKKENQRNIILGIGTILLILAVTIWSRLRYVRKSKAILQIEKDRSEHLLLNILPEEIAQELKQKGYVDAQDIDTASILFTDFKSFTETAAKLSPKELVAEINTCFKTFDAIMERYDIEKIKTIGDAYMAAGGLPKPTVDSVKKTILAGLEMQTFISKRKLENEQQNIPAFEMRVGIHVGPIVAGIVGVKKFQYDIWGDTVNTASRMESNGDVGKVNISQNVYNIVKNEEDFSFEYRGKIKAKGKGEMEMYFVTKSL
ncbi:adenylate/guanylate cyclase domain-containing protein [Aquimarina sp. 2201CG1-2-11]|uniref:adenylate/guanylate cyclase domain-containing protein n=1 Tax=Aquimarina discodermiae TaxID=3231043 RepID=UPI003461FFDB